MSPLPSLLPILNKTFEILILFLEIPFQRNKDASKYAFMIPSCLLIAAAVFYGLFSSGESLPWAEEKGQEQTRMNEVPDTNLIKNDKNEA
jgi:hypothetical protein